MRVRSALSMMILSWRCKSLSWFLVSRTATETALTGFPALRASRSASAIHEVTTSGARSPAFAEILKLHGIAEFLADLLARSSGDWAGASCGFTGAFPARACFTLETSAEDRPVAALAKEALPLAASVA